MRLVGRTLVVAALIVGSWSSPAAAQDDPPGPPTTLAHEHRVAGDEIISSEFPIDFVGVLHEGESRGGAVRFRRDGRWGRWHDLEEDGIDTPGTWASGLVSGGDADAFQLRGAGGGAGARAIVINTTDGPVRSSTSAATNCDDQSPILTRCEWGADESLMSWAPQYYPPQKLTVHHTATTNGDVDPAATVRAIYRYHAVDRGFGDIGYQYLLDESGRVYEGRYSGTDPSPGEDATGNVVTAAHVGGYNSGNTGIALLGTLTAVPAAPAARDALERLLGELSARHGIDPHGATTYVNPVNGVEKAVANISGHRDWAPTECPGDQLYVELPAIRDAAAGGAEPGPDESAPIISAISVSATARTATVRWLTDEPATSAVDVRRRGTSTWSQINDDPNVTTDHLIMIDGLNPRTKYEFRVISRDNAGNTATSATGSFTTTRR